MNWKKNIPYHIFDIVNYNTIKDKEYKRHIDSVGKTIWKSKPL